MTNALYLETEETFEFHYLQGLRTHEKYKEVIHFLDALVKDQKKCDAVVNFLWAEIQMINTSYTLDTADYKILYADYDEVGYEIDVVRLNKDQEDLERRQEKASEDLAKSEVNMEKSGTTRSQLDQFETHPEDLVRFIENIRAEAVYLQRLEKDKAKQIVVIPAVEPVQQEPSVRSKGMSK